MDMKKFFKQHILTILCAAALVTLLLPFISINTEVQIMGASSGSSIVLTGFNALNEALLGWGLVLGPIVLVAMNYIKQLEKHKGLLAIIVPIICLIIEIITFFQAKSASVSASGGNGMVNAEVSASLGIGFFVLILVYLGMVVAGAVIYHNFTLDKAGLERLKTEGSSLLGDSINKIKEGSSNIINSAGVKISNMSGEETQKPTKKTVNHSKAEETLCLIEKLASMRDSGVLTEEEFSTKKKELLEEI